MTRELFALQRASIASTALVAAATSALAIANEAHEHGASNLLIALEGEQLRVEFESPLANLIGFEHAPETAAQRGAASALQDILNAPVQIVRLPANAKCALADTAPITIDGPDYIVAKAADDSTEHDEHDGHHDDDHHDDEHHNDDHHEHGAHHDDGHHDDHDKAHADHDEHDHDDEHSDVAVSYNFSCTQPGALTSIDVMAFTTFPGIEHIDVQAVGERGAIAKELTANTATLDLSSL
ncbi:MAG: DUF2796 domain-containing protein [Pseudomonadota bacterium]